MDTCDICMFPLDETWMAIERRPSCREELCSVMYACSTCGPEVGFYSPAEVEAICREVEETMSWQGEPTMWLSL